MAENNGRTEPLLKSSSTEASNNFLRKAAKAAKDSFIAFSAGAVTGNVMMRIGEALTQTTWTAAEREVGSLRGGAVAVVVSLAAEAGLALSNRQLTRQNETARK